MCNEYTHVQVRSTVERRTKAATLRCFAFHLAFPALNLLSLSQVIWVSEKAQIVHLPVSNFVTNPTKETHVPLFFGGTFSESHLICW